MAIARCNLKLINGHIQKEKISIVYMLPKLIRFEEKILNKIITTFTILLLTLMTGCVSQREVTLYSNKTNYVQMPDDKYRVFESKNSNKIILVSSLGNYIPKDLLKNITYGLVNTDAPKINYKAAARKYLNEHGREKCDITNDGDVPERGRYEFIYVCPEGFIPQKSI
ncbi:hypothetical protein [Bartonella sp. HY761]|uniref:hypothetical protein n=1 Tax=Bartonella sp. HY761 TaxID=2979330 RepID=UPI002207D5D7|nr:hypothetical protein [Bartonella sp. HY761]UXN06677.1 hypothetical protein N6A79_01285 [Bartonella sp. HY761]